MHESNSPSHKWLYLVYQELLIFNRKVTSKTNKNKIYAYIYFLGFTEINYI